MMTEIRTDRMAELIANLNKNQAWTSSEAFEVYNEITRLEDKLYKVTRACVCLDCGKTTVIDPEKPELAYTELKAHSLVCEKNPHIKAITQLKAEIARLEGVVEELQAEALVLFRKSQSLIDEKADLQRDIEMCHDERISQNSGTE